jgi:hypothetical protein
MKITNAMKLRDNVAFSGPCENVKERKRFLVDEVGNIYDTYKPLGKDLVVDDSRIMLAMKGNYDIESLKGRELRNYDELILN